MEAIILAGGFGTRLSHIVSDVPKPMAPVAGRPFLRYLLDDLATTGFTRVVLAVGHMRHCIEDYFEGCYRGMDLIYSAEDAPLLTGGAVKKALCHCRGEYVFVLNGDSYLSAPFEAMLVQAERDRPAALLAVKEMHAFDRYGTIILGGSGDAHPLRIRQFKEKEPTEQGMINAGVYCLQRELLDDMPDAFSLENDFFEKYVGDLTLEAYPCDGLFIDIGIPEDYERAQGLFREKAKTRCKIAFFDRDGTINVDTGHLHEPDQMVLIDSTVELIRQKKKQGYTIVVITNQAGIAKGFYTTEDMHLLHDHMNRELEKLDAKVDAFYFCPHHPDYTGPCSCRKPKPGMIMKALFDFEASPKECLMVGDKETDMEAAQAAGIWEHVLIG